MRLIALDDKRDIPSDALQREVYLAMVKCLRGESDTIQIRFDKRSGKAKVDRFGEQSKSDWVKAA